MEEQYQAVDFDSREKAYILIEFPYPSGSGLHIGHSFSYTGTDVYSRFLRMQGKNVLFPIGWDAFGLPTENFAIRTGRKPQDVTRENTDTYRRQMKMLGISFDWSREINTTDPDYYRWTQWIFIKLFEHGLAYKTEIPINWCPSCKVGLANEEVVAGQCERCGSEVTRRRINQWVVKITEYADRLIEGLEHTRFIDKVKTAQVNWIGRSEGARIRFPLAEGGGELEVFTTRPDTLWGATFMVVAPEHELVEQTLARPDVSQYVRASLKKSDLERTNLLGEKSGVYSGRDAINPATGERIPIWVSDFVLMSYGSGAVMAVPAHDQRDFEFASLYGLPIRPVIDPPGGWDYSARAYETRAGKMSASGPLDGLEVEKAIQRAIKWLEDDGVGSRSVSYHLRDWIFSRQHYWGEPIPMVHCPQHGWLPVAESELPVLLPEVDQYQPTDSGESPLANIPGWVETTCPTCGGPARRETDTMPNWAGSDWYSLRYTDPHNQEALADLEKMRYWLPVDLYIGGDEHNTLHLLYSRFIYLFLRDIGAVPAEIREPYARRVSHGVILGPDGQRMSKSRNNVIIPDEMIEKYGVDATRTYMMFIGPFDATMAWSERTLNGVRRFLERFEKYISGQIPGQAEPDREIHRITNRLLAQVSADLNELKFNTAVAKIMEALNQINASQKAIGRDDLAVLIQVIAPFAPFLAESLWTKAGQAGSVHSSRWPRVDESLLVADRVEIAVQINGKLRGTMVIDATAEESSVIEQARQVEGAARFLAGKDIKKVIYVKGRTLNFVTN